MYLELSTHLPTSIKDIIYFTKIELNVYLYWILSHNMYYYFLYYKAPDL